MAALLKIPPFIAYGARLGIAKLAIVDRLGIRKALGVHCPKTDRWPDSSNALLIGTSSVRLSASILALTWTTPV